MPFFVNEETAERYDRFRPYVHEVALDWLKTYSGRSHFFNALDIACGTGHSTLPLIQIADTVLGIDISMPMLSFARQKGLEALHTSLNDFQSTTRFDLITTCMAFHWFDPANAIPKYKKLSKNNAIWLIYNFGFGGHATSNQINDWLSGRYSESFPAPPRGKYKGVIPQNDQEVALLHKAEGNLPIQFNIDSLVGYLTTQSNVENAVQQGQTYKEIETFLRSELDSYVLDGYFKYLYSFEVYRFREQVSP